MIAIPDDLSIPEFLRRELTPEAKAAIARLSEREKNQFRRRRFQRRHLTDEQATERRIEDEADRRWRSWIPTKEEHHRPRLSTFERLVRKEFKAKVKRRDAMSEAATAAAAATEESVMGKTKASKSKARAPVKGKTSAKAPESAPALAHVRAGSKLETIVKLLKREEGCTTADVLKATGWPSVSMPQQAKAAGLQLLKEKKGGVTVYRAA